MLCVETSWPEQIRDFLLAVDFLSTPHKIYDVFGRM